MAASEYVSVYDTLIKAREYLIHSVGVSKTHWLRLKLDAAIAEVEEQKQKLTQRFICNDCGKPIIIEGKIEVDPYNVFCQQCDPAFASLLDNKHNPRHKEGSGEQG